MDTGYQQMEEERLKEICISYNKLKSDLRKLVEEAKGVAYHLSPDAEIIIKMVEELLGGVVDD